MFRSKDPAQRHRDDLAKHQRHLATLSGRIEDARRRKGEADAARAEMLTNGEAIDDAALVKAGKTCQSAADELEAFEAAHRTMLDKIAVTEAAIAQAEDAAIREKIAAECEARQGRLGKAVDGISDAIAALASAYQKLFQAVDKDGVAIPSDIDATIQLPSAFAASMILVDELRRQMHEAFQPNGANLYLLGIQHSDGRHEAIARHLMPLAEAAQAIRAGTVPAVAPPIHLPPPAHISRVEIAPERVVLLQSISWFGWGPGRANARPDRLVASPGNVELPKEIADRAVEQGYAVRLNTPAAAHAAKHLMDDLKGQLAMVDGRLKVLHGGDQLPRTEWVEVDFDQIGWAEQERQRLALAKAA